MVSSAPAVFELGIHWLCKGFFLLGVFFSAGWAIQYIPRSFWGWNSWHRKLVGVFLRKKTGCHHRPHCPFTWFQWWSIWCGLEVVEGLKRGVQFSIYSISLQRQFFLAAFWRHVWFQSISLKKKSGEERFRATLDYILISPQLEVRRFSWINSCRAFLFCFWKP